MRKEAEGLNELFLNALVQASHRERKAQFRTGFEKSLLAEEDNYAYLFKAFELWTDEEYWLAEELLGVLQDASEDENLRKYASLGTAHVLRRRAEQALQELESRTRRQIPVQQGLQETITGHTSRARTLYQNLTPKRQNDSRVRAVAYHCLAILDDLELRLTKLLVQNPQTFRNLLRSLRRKERESIQIAEEAGFDYAPPHNRLGNWSRKLGVREGHYRTAISLCRDKPYAPPKIGLAHVLWDRYRSGKDFETAVTKTLELLREAVMDAPDDRFVREDLSRFADMLQKEGDRGETYVTARFGQIVAAKELSLREYFQRPRRTREEIGGNFLVVLRRWSSYSPAIVSGERFTFGGGYLVDWKGYRLAIDPGYGFLRNLHTMGLSAIDLDGVALTHDHPDHTADFEALLSLFYERRDYWEKNKGKALTKNLALPREQQDGAQLDLFLNPSTYRKWRNLLESAPYKRELVQLRPRDLVDLDGRGIRLIATQVHRHKDLSRKPAGVGIKLELGINGTSKPMRVVGFVGDTGYWGEDKSELATDFRDSDILVVHLSTVADILTADKHDLVQPQNGIKLDVGVPFQGFYKKHLGFFGTIALLRDLVNDKPEKHRTVLFDEFGEEFIHCRREVVVDILRRVYSLIGRGEPLRCEVADTGTCLDLDRKQFRCQFGGLFCPREVQGEPLEYTNEVGKDKTMAHQPPRDEALLYLCSEHHSLVERLRNTVVLDRVLFP